MSANVRETLEQFAPTPIGELRVRALMIARKAKSNPEKPRVGLEDMQKIGASVDMQFEDLAAKKAAGKLTSQQDLQNFAVIAAIKATRDFSTATLRFTDGVSSDVRTKSALANAYGTLRQSVGALLELQRRDVAQRHFSPTLITLHDVMRITGSVLPSTVGVGKVGPSPELISILDSEEGRLRSAGLRTFGKYIGMIEAIRAEWGLNRKEEPQPFIPPQLGDILDPRIETRINSVTKRVVDSGDGLSPELSQRLDQAARRVRRSAPKSESEVKILSSGVRLIPLRREI